MEILMIEDDRDLASVIKTYLGTKGYYVDVTDEALEGETRALKNGYDCIILDLALPDKNGLEICRNLRENGVTTAILILSAHGKTDLKVTGLNIGADDYLTKPFENEELLARIQALTRRTATSGGSGDNVSNVIRQGELEIDLINREFRVCNAPVKLSGTEFKLMGLFMTNPDKIQDKSELAEKIGDGHVSPYSNSLNVYISYLRKKLSRHTSKNYLQTVRNAGFILKTNP